MVDVERLRGLLDRLRDTEGELRRLRELGREATREDVDRLNSATFWSTVTPTSMTIG